MKLVKAFITVDQYIDNTTDVVSPVYELSDYALTFSRVKKQYYYSQDPSYSLYLFNTLETDSLTQQEVDTIVITAKYLNQFLNQNTTYDKQTLIAQVINYVNSSITSDRIKSLDYSNVTGTSFVKAASYITFSSDNLQVSVWCGYNDFEIFYPDYEVVNVFPIDNLNNNISNPSYMIQNLNKFNIIDFNNKIQSMTDKKPPTSIKIINIPYTIKSTGVKIDCYFGFIIYGPQGTYDYVLKLQLFDYLSKTLNIPQTTITSFFPDILNVNEFFIIPRWDYIAIPSQVGVFGINSQVTKTYSQPFDTDKYISVYSDLEFIKDNTYNVPFDYNNILLQVTNGYYTEEAYKDFFSYYSDIITVNSLDIDFSRMSSKTQHLITLINEMISVADVGDKISLVNKILANKDYQFSTIIRSGTMYLSYFYDKHQYYVLPRFEMTRIQSGG